MRWSGSIGACVVLLAIAGCDEVNRITVNLPTDPTPTITTNAIEFRAVGTATGVRIRHVNPIDGLSQVTTVLPFVATVRTEATVFFVSLDVTPLGYGLAPPFLSVQIFVNGTLFREGSSSEFFLTPISVSGTWRK